MFGYVKAYTPELLVREHEFYRALYCGLCSSMKRLTGAASTFTLSYDMVFLSLCRMAVGGGRYEVSQRRCCMNPLRLKKRVIMADGEELRYASAISALLTECKLADDKTDEGGIKKLSAMVLHHGAKKRLARAGVPAELQKTVREKLSALYELEASEPKTVSFGAEIFGDLLGKIFAFGFFDADGRILYEIGRGVGRYIYIIDAVDDLSEDVKSGRYNAIAAGWRDQITDGELSDRAKESIMDAVKLELSRAAGALELITVPDGGYPETLSIAKNILYIGLPKETERVLSKDKTKKRGKT